MPEQGGALNTNVNNGGDGETAISSATWARSAPWCWSTGSGG